MPSLSTSQLVVIWYAGILIFLTLTNSSNALYKALGVTILAGLILYTLKPHPNASKKKVFLWVILPVPTAYGLFIGGILLSGLLMDRNERRSCEAALARIAVEERNAETGDNGLGRELKMVLERSDKFSNSNSGPVTLSELQGYRHFEKEIIRRWPAFENCTSEERNEIVERWIQKFAKRQ